MPHAIDTLRITQELESAGVDRRQAEAHAEALNEVVVTQYSELATEADVERLPTRDEQKHFATKADLERFATRAELADLEKRMFRLWAASTVTLAMLIISMPFVAGRTPNDRRRGSTATRPSAIMPAGPRGPTPPRIASPGAGRRLSRRPRPRASGPSLPDPAAPRASSRGGP